MMQHPSGKKRLATLRQGWVKEKEKSLPSKLTDAVSDQNTNLQMAAYQGTKNSMDLAIDPLISCRLCLSECTLQEMYELHDCKCLYCEKCMRQYLQVMIVEGNIMAITCPDAACKKQGRLQPSEIANLVEAKLFDRYKRLRHQREVDLDPNRTFCPEAGCETVCHVCSTSSGESTKPIAVDCPTCGLKFCSICKSGWHTTKTCDEMMLTGRLEDAGIPYSSAEDACIKRCPVCHVPIERNDGCAQMMCKRCKHVFCWYCLASLDVRPVPLKLAIPYSSAEDACIKRCPVCHVPIERNDGCAQMMCKRCKHVFCWYCLASLDDDFLLRHYDKGPCKNKLGHSRASVIWHRTQVVGIFAGFGVLLLVASPFLLLAAPCILCCKCKICKCCEDDDEPQPPL